MKELKSTGVLEEQIRLEAVKKVQAIYDNCEKECAEILQKVDLELETARNQKQEFYNKKLKDAEKNLEATLPLEKQRLELSFVQNALITQINMYLKGLSEEERLSLIINELNKNKELLSEKKFYAYIYGFDFDSAKKELEKHIKSNLKNIEKTAYGKMLLEDELALEKQQGIILEAEDKSLRIRLTLNQIIGNLLNVKRDELAFALFGGDEK